MGKITVQDNKVTYTMRDETIVIEPYGADCIRVRATRCGTVSDESWTLLPPEDCKAEITADNNRAEIKNGKISVEIFNVWGGYRMVFYRGGKAILRTSEEGDPVRRYEHIEGDNEIWSFGERNYPILKELILLRGRLKPYILKHMKQSAETGAPLMRPMFFDFYEDETCYNLSDQYMFGPDILFAPVYRQGETERQVYLPEGKWIRTTDKTVYDGGKYISCRAEVDEFIAFVREGAEVIDVF